MSKFSVRKPLTVFVSIIAILILGYVAFTEMVPDLLPNMDMPYAVVMTVDTGASPEEVEETVSKPIEQSMATIENIKNVYSVSSESYSLVMLEFNDKVNMDAVTIDIRDKISLIEGNWDDNVSTPTIMKINPDMMPVSVSAISKDGLGIIDLTNYYKDSIESTLEGVEGVASVQSSGLVEEGVSVVISDKKIEKVNKKIVKAIEKKFDTAQKKIDSSSQTLTSGKSAITSQIAKLEAQQKRLVALKKQLAEIKKSADDLKENKSSLTNTINTLTELYNNMNEWQSIVQDPQASAVQKARAQAKLDNAEKRLKNLGIKKSDIPSIVDKANKSLSKINSALDKIEKTLKKQNLTISGLPGKIEEVNDALDQIATAIPTLRIQLNQIGQSENEINQAKDKLNSSKKSAVNKANLKNTLTKDTISSILTAQNFSMPAGYITETGGDYLVKVGNKFTDIDEVKNLELVDLGLSGISPIKLSDVADVFIADNADTTYAKINDQDGILLVFSKQSTYATAQVSDNINKTFENLEKTNKGLKFTSFMDQGEYIHIIISAVLNNLLVGAVLAIFILFLFLKDIKPTGIIACSIPISVLFAIVLMYFSGVSLNMISLSGLAVGVGMLVDNSVVVIENIYRLKDEGYSTIKAAISGATQVAGAITSSTLTTVCVFLPIVFVDGITKQIFVDMALTIGYSLLASLIIALTFVPALASKAFVKIDKKEIKFFENIKEKYVTFITKVLDKKAYVLIGSVVLLILSFGITVSRGFIFMPEMEGTEISVNINMPKGSTTEETMQTTDAAIAKVKGIKGVKTVAAMLDNGSMTTAMGSMGGSSKATSSVMYVILDEKGHYSSKDISDKIIKNTKDIGAEEVVVNSGSSMMSGMDTLLGNGVELEIYCDDNDTLQKAARLVSNELKKVKAIEKVDDGLDDTTTQINVVVNKKKAIKCNLTVAQIYQQIAGELRGDVESTTLGMDGENYQVTISDAKKDKIDLNYIKRYNVAYTDKSTNKSSTVPLNKIAKIGSGVSLNNISRQSQKKYMTVTGKLKEGENITLVTDDVKKQISKVKLPKGVDIEYAGENENIMDSMFDLLKMLALSVIIIYLIMVAQFQSLLSPFIIMFTIPLAFTGGLIGLFVAGKEISVISMIGFIMLSGIIVNNGIVLVDYINRLRIDGMDKRSAIIKAGETRLRPILMTALTTILGLVMMAIGVGTGAEIVQPIAIVCIGGLIYATVMTLFVVPILYDIFNKKDMNVIKAEDLEIIED